LIELSSSPRKAKTGVAGFTMRFPSGRGAGIWYMADSDALLRLHTVGCRCVNMDETGPSGADEPGTMWPGSQKFLPPMATTLWNGFGGRALAAERVAVARSTRF